MKAKIFNGLIILSLLVLAFANSSWGGVALEEEFDTDLSKWVVLDEPNNVFGPGDTALVTVELTGWGELEFNETDNDRFRKHGVQSIDQYPLPSGGALVVDFYGNNHDIWGVSGHTNPVWLIASYPTAEEQGFFSTDNSDVDPNKVGWISVKGWNAYGDYGIGNNCDWVMWNGHPDVYTQIWVPNPAEPPVPPYISLTKRNYKHVIFAINESFINVYIEDDYYENLSGPTALYTVATSDVFTTEELTDGLYVYVLGERYTSWYSGKAGELFDGVKVTRVGATSPINCYEAKDMGYGDDDADLNDDCRHDLYDFDLIGQDWMEDVNVAPE